MPPNCPFAAPVIEPAADALVPPPASAVCALPAAAAGLAPATPPCAATFARVALSAATLAATLAPGTRKVGGLDAARAADGPPPLSAAPARPGRGLDPLAPTGPPELPPLPPRAPCGERGRRHSKQFRRREKLGWNPHAVQRQSPSCGRRTPSAPAPWPPDRAAPLEFEPRIAGSLPRAPACFPNVLPPPPPPAPAAPPSKRSRSSRRPCRREMLSPSAPPPPPRRCGIACRAGPPPPWWDARRRLAASTANSARAAWRWRLARRCQACSPRAVMAEASDERPWAARAARRRGQRKAAREAAEEPAAKEVGGRAAVARVGSSREQRLPWREWRRAREPGTSVDSRPDRAAGRRYAQRPASPRGPIRL